MQPPEVIAKFRKGDLYRRSYIRCGAWIVLCDHQLFMGFCTHLGYMHTILIVVNTAVEYQIDYFTMEFLFQ